MAKATKKKSSSVQHRQALNAICPYFTMFPLDFPLRKVKQHRDARLVLDPFCGRGTTLFAARYYGIRAVGVDSSPVAVAISQAKLARADVDECLQLGRRLIERTKEPISPEGEFWDLAFHPETLKELCQIRDGLLGEPLSDSVALLRAAILGSLHGPITGSGSYVSNQMQRTFAPKPSYAVRFWKERSMLPPRADLLAAVKRRLSRMVMPERGQSNVEDVFKGDSTKLGTFHSIAEEVDLVVTSPPYYGMRTYVQDQWLRNWFLGGSEYVDYSEGEQLPSSSQEAFAQALGEVWANIAKKSSERLNLYVRFGSIPSRDVDSKKLFFDSLESSDRQWRLISVRNASTADAGRRQVRQMRTHASAVAEFDFHVALEGGD